MGCCQSSGVYEGTGGPYELSSSTTAQSSLPSTNAGTTPLSPSGAHTPSTFMLYAPHTSTAVGAGQASGEFRLDPSVRSFVPITNKPSFSSSYHGHAYSDGGGSSFVGLGNVGGSSTGCEHLFDQFPLVIPHHVPVTLSNY